MKTDGSYQYGGFFQRVAAMSVDVFIVTCFCLLLWCAETLALGRSLLDPMLTPAAMLERSSLILLGAMMFMDALYFTYFHSVTGQTIGKRLMALKVVTVDGGQLSLGQSFLRWCGYLPSKWFFLLGFLWVAFSGKKRGWHDYLAGTVVIRLGTEFPPTP